MDKGKIARYLAKGSKYTAEQKRLLNAVEKAREELNIAREYFNTVDDPRLVDYAIYTEEAAKAKYMYLLNEAKKNGLKVDGNNILKELNVG
ncbi:YaaL family protein [Clostridium sp. DJ247]|uniref:YaaL family protein n=1 Tax=Clostridium sp. DJ247 TaxID=2726188 RepID=UPI001625BEDB|nr:YaaL family protein [Clostridium sp. DJ247]MBC2582852.1 YaaL family protein [Clostridium sp. DJ247]